MIDKIQDLYHMLLLAQGIGWHCADIMEVHAPFHARFWSFQRLMWSGI
jgi:hypothetical protein